MKKGRWILFTGLFLSGLVLNAQKTDPRQTILFDTDWKFHLGHAADPSKDFNYRVANIYSKSGSAENSAIDPRFKDEDWSTVQLPTIGPLNCHLSILPILMCNHMAINRSGDFSRRQA